MKRIAELALIGTLLASAPALATESVLAQVNGMVCAFCAQGIEAKLRTLPQTQDVYVNLGQSIVAVQMKEGTRLSTDTVREVVKDAGYEVAAIKVVPRTMAQIKADTLKQ